MSSAAVKVERKKRVPKTVVAVPMPALETIQEEVPKKKKVLNGYIFFIFT